MVDDGPLVSLVDDDASFRQATRSLLRSAGFRVQASDSAEQFLEETDLAGVRCLIVDLRMPGMSGLDLQRRVEASGYDIPIIFVTAHADDRSQSRAMNGGAIAFLPKPFDAEELIGAVRAAIKGSRPVW